MQPIARVNPKYFAAINKFAAVSDVRYYLNGVFIEPHPVKGVVIVATDGHTLALLHDPDGWVKEPIIVGDITKQLISACSARGIEHRMTVPKLLYISQKGAVVTGDAKLLDEVDPFDMLTLHMSKIELIDAKYPDYRRVINKKRGDTAVSPCINSAYLARLHEVAKILIPNHKYGWGIEMLSYGREVSMIARFTQCDLEQRFLGLIMPMQSEGPKNPLPDWLMPVAVETTNTETSEA